MAAAVLRELPPGSALVPGLMRAKGNIFMLLPQAPQSRFFAMPFLLLSLAVIFLCLLLTQSSLLFVVLSYPLSPKLCHEGLNASAPRFELHKAGIPTPFPSRILDSVPSRGQVELRKSPERGDYR